VAINPNSNPGASGPFDPQPTRVFESAILLYLSEKFGGAFAPTEVTTRASALWLFWQMGATHFGGGFGTSTRTRRPRSSTRSTATRWRSSASSTLDRHLATNAYMAGRYTIADMAIWPWYGGLIKGVLYESAEFLSVQEYRHVARWTEQIAERPAVKRGRIVNRPWGDPPLAERHSSADFAALKLD
jgi:GST-like protein